MFMESDAKRRIIRIAVWIAVLGMVIGVLSSLVAATSASAHASLRSVSPSDGARLTAPPEKVVLTFTEAVSTSFATVSVTGTSGGSLAQGSPAVSGATVTQPLVSDLTSGIYAVAYRVVSKDGHPVSGKTSFSLSLPASSDSPAEPSSLPTTSATSPDSAGTSPTQGTTETATAAGGSGATDDRPTRLALAVAIGALALAAGTALVAAARRRDQT